MAISAAGGATPPVSPPPAASARWTSLDGLRGLASLVVVFTHLRLAGAEVGAPAMTPEQVREAWLRGGFLGVFSDGATAVAIFFVLSGVVLVLPMLRRSGLADWLAYYPRRVLRLYLPIWGSLLLGLLWAMLVPRRDDPSLPVWVADHIPNLGRGALFRAFAAIQSTNLNTPLWSLHWEVLFSLLLPLYVLAVAPRSRWWPWLVALAASAAILAGAATGDGTLLFMPQFLLGAVIASRLSGIREWLERLPGAAQWAISGLALLSLLGVGYLDVQGLLPTLTWTLRMTVAVLAVLIFLAFPVARRLADTRTVQWLGQVSFSLYLVHEPLLVSLRLLFPLDYWQLLGVGLPLSLLLAQAFYLVVERPAHLASRHVGRWVSARAATLLPPARAS